MQGSLKSDGQVKCSLEQPSCAQCIKSGRDCLGYAKEIIFVTVEPGEVSSPRRITSPKTLPNQAPTSLDQSIVESLFIGSIREQMLKSYIARYHAAATSTPLNPPSWITNIPDIPMLSKALQTTAYALCTARLGRDENNKDLVQQSLALYTKGLYQVQRSLWDPKTMYSDQCLAACMLLCIYEVMECPSKNRSGYLSHYHGCARLIQLRGPQRHVNGLGHTIFSQFRIIGVRHI